MKSNKSIVIAVLLMLVAFGWAAYIYKSQQAESADALAEKHSEALIRPHSPKIGNPSAKVTIVEFLDPACETCGQFYPMVKDILKQYDGKVNLVVRYAPFHPRSDEMVAILQAAQEQGKFWPMLKIMFETQPEWVSHHKAQPEVFWQYLEKSGLNVAEFKQAVAKESVAQAIRQDVADGVKLGVNKTPTFFVNGKPLPSFGYEQLATLVASEVQKN